MKQKTLGKKATIAALALELAICSPVSAAETDYISQMLSDKDRMHWLFPNGIPTKPSQMDHYLKEINVTVNTEDGTEEMTLLVHKKLASELEDIFDELLDVEDFYINTDECYSYNWREMASGSGRLSHHSYGVCIDLNSTANPPVYWDEEPDTESPYYCSDDVVEIFKDHGFYWGGDWSEKYYDPMHFTFTDH